MNLRAGAEWDQPHAYRLLQTFKSIPQKKNYHYDETKAVASTIWHLSDRHIHNDISIEYRNRQTIVTVLLALQKLKVCAAGTSQNGYIHAVVRYATDNGTDRRAIRKILNDRYAVSM